MNIVLMMLGRWHRPLVCIAWLLTLLGLIAGSRFEMFLIPGFIYILWPAVAILFLLALAGIVEPPLRRLGPREAAGVVLLLLPLAGIAGTDGAILDASTFDTRFVGNFQAAGDDAGAKTAPPLPGAGGDSRTARIPEVLLTDLLRTPSLYIGRRIAVVGMLTRRSEQVADLLDRRVPLLFRFVMNCCAADAIPFAVVAEIPDNIPVEENGWSRVSGSFALRRIKGNDIPILEDTAMESIPMPKRPYL
ncbi:MAG: TIGR03943 family protein [Planctomycetota bacterium]|jgi:uncharacterized repeat protein (TIGR03943 family)|nr:TIGR03943 family protein [Planctomycetota bacterium]